MAATVQELSLLLRLRDEASRGLQNFQTGLQSLTRGLQNSHEKMYRMGGTFNNLVAVGGRFMMTGQQIGQTWRASMQGLEKYTDAAMKLYQAQSRFRTINLGPVANERAFAAVRDVVKDIQGITLAETTEGLLDATTAVNDLGKGIALLPALMKYKFSFSTLFGDTMDKGAIDAQVLSMSKVLDLLGYTQKSSEELNAMMDTMVRITSATGGRVTPSEVLTMARRAGPAAQGLTPTGLRNITSLIEEMGAPKVGTALMSLYQAGVGGQMKLSSMNEFMRLGLVNKDKVEYTKAGLPKKMKAGALKFSSVMQEDPLAAADMIMEAMRKPMEGPPIDTSNMQKVREELAVLFGNRTAQHMMSMLTTQRAQVVKEAERGRTAKGMAEMMEEAADSPMGKLKKFEAAMENFRTKVGVPMLELGTQIATGLMPVLAWFDEHPRVAKFVAVAIPAITVLTASLQTLFLLQATGAFGIVTFFKNWVTGATAAAAAQARLAAAAVATPVVGRGEGFIGPPRASTATFLPPAQQVSRLRSAMSAIAPVLTTTVVLAGIPIIMQQLYNLKQEYDDFDREYGEGKAKARTEYDTAVAGGQAFKTVSHSEELNAEIDRAIDRLNAGGQLTKAFAPDIAGEKAQRLFGYGAMSPKPYGQYFTKEGYIDPKKYAPEHAAPKFAEMMPGIIGNVSKMAALIARAQAGTLPGVPIAAREQIFETLKLADPKTYEQAVEMLAHTTKAAETSMFGVTQPAGDLAAQLGNASASAARFAISVGTLQMPGMLGMMGPLGVMTPKPGLGPAAPAGGMFGPKKAGLAISMVPGAAGGAIIERSGIINVHGGETVEPARIARLKGRGAAGINVNYSPTIHASGDPEQFERQLAAHSRVLAELLSDELAGYMERT